MFTNINGKVKALAKVLCILGIIGSVITGIAIMSGSSMMSSYYGYSGGGGAGVLMGLLVMVIGSVIAWASSLALYAFGQMGENVEYIRQKLDHQP